MTQVESVRGPIASDTVGATLMHEHVFIFTPEFPENYPEIIGWDEDVKVKEAIERLTALKAAGIDTLVDLTVMNMGRYIPRLQQINEAVDINIIVATGVYTYDGLPHFLNLFGPGSLVPDREPMVEMFVKDITVGIADTGIKAGILKCCTDKPGVTPTIERVLRATAQAHRATGVPISTHTDAGLRRGLEQQDIFENEGVDLSRVVIGHSGDTNDLDYLEEVLRRGSYLGMDRFGMEDHSFLSFDERVRVVADLCEKGYADKMVLSHDASCWMDWLPNEFRAGTAVDFPNWHFLHISENVLPALKARGVTDDQIKAMLVDNPRKIFEANSTY
ncbi:MAG: php [Frankiales bacterium]|nr:php [Frankiales bacterium]